MASLTKGKNVLPFVEAVSCQSSAPSFAINEAIADLKSGIQVLRSMLSDEQVKFARIELEKNELKEKVIALEAENTFLNTALYSESTVLTEKKK